jgi:hypothetical protein
MRLSWSFVPLMAQHGAFLGDRHHLPPLRHLCFLETLVTHPGAQSDLPKGCFEQWLSF